MGEQRIADLKAAGYSDEKIAEVLQAEGVNVSRRTVARRRKGELGQTPPVPNVAAAAKPLPESEADIPEDVDPGTLDDWIRRVHAQSVVAEKAGNLDLFGKLTRLSTTLLEIKRKATPPPRPSPNDNPDMVKLAQDVAARLHKMIDQVVT